MDAGALARVSAALAGRYRFDHEVGRGGGGCVWDAHDLARNRRVAIKCMTVGGGFLAKRERYLREIEVEARLAHGHIVPLFDSGEVDEIVYFVMPFVEGGSLQARLEREGALPVQEALRIAHEVATGLAHAHAKGVVHRDIKPGNILFLAGDAVIADFGIARVHEAGQDHRPRTTDLVPVGTPHYMSPEQADGDRPIDGRSDIYSLGCVLFEMLVGHPPFEGRTNAEILQRHALDPVPPIRTVRTPVAAEVEAVVMRCLQKMPGDRYPNAAAMVEAIEGAKLAKASAAPLRGPRWRRIALVGATAIAVGGGTWWAASERVLSRLIERADTTRIVLFPIEGADSADAMDERLRRALSQWRGVSAVDPFVVREAIGTAALTTERASRIALSMRAGRFVRGTVATTGAGVELRLALSEAGRRPRALAEDARRVARDERAVDSSLAAMVEAVMLREPLPPDASSSRLSTRSLPALQAYAHGRSAVARWEIDSAIASFEHAWATDRSFGSAALWLALTKYWKGARSEEWTYAAYAARGDIRLMSTSEAGVARAMVATALGRTSDACAEWDKQKRRAQLDFVGWYGAALCRDRDSQVVRDARSPSGWSLRSSYATALADFIRAFALARPMHKALSARSFEPLRTQLVVRAGYTRFGSSEDGSLFLAAPRLLGDSVVFVPYPLADVQRALPSTLSDSGAQASIERRQRELFRSLASMWAAESRESPDAREALALALQLQGTSSALDTIAAARVLESRGAGRFRLAATDAWMRVAFALPDDWSALSAAGAIADSVLSADTSSATIEARAGLAALFGRSRYVLGISRYLTVRLDRRLPDPVAKAARELTLRAALGYPRAQIAEAERTVDSTIIAEVDAPQRAVMRGLAFARAARLAWPRSALSDSAMRSVADDYLLPMLLALDAGDSAAFTPRFDAFLELRRRVPARNVSFDALLTESALLARSGHADMAALWLDDALSRVRTTVPDLEPIRTAALVRCAILRADLAAAAGERQVARRWAGAVVALWGDADAELQQEVARMRRLTK